MLNMHENQWTKFVQSQQYNHKNDISDVVLVSLSSTSEGRVLRDIQKSTLELFLQFNRQKLKYSTGFLIHFWKFEKVLLWLTDFDFAGLLEIFYQFHEHIIQIFQNFILRKNQAIWCLRLSRIWKKLTILFNSFLNYKPKKNIWNKTKESSKTGQDKKSLISTFPFYLTVIAKI